ncbi:hypothetical protein [uncultured Hydrogenophaga sp.]|uniref:hypothetical protein n=1 Tax=uncultured Hydrogenophaga sp. TaxID=199683 RepID=UPI0025881FFF|nr:hypothetical protein [uncultured Hydrogenophaga sp.]
MKLIPVPATHIDFAWDSDGASCLAEACATSSGDITGDQLRMLLARGERVLIRMENDDGTAAGWGAVLVEQLPNVRVLTVTSMTAHNGHFERFFDELKTLARVYGCSKVRCAAKPAQARLYRQKVGFTPVYEILEVSAL